MSGLHGAPWTHVWFQPGPAVSSLRGRAGPHSSGSQKVEHVPPEAPRVTFALVALLLAQVATSDEGNPAGTGRVSLSGGVGSRSVQLDEPHVLTTGVSGLSPTQVRFSAAWFFWRFLGCSADFAGEWYVATGRDLNGDPSRLPMSSLRGAGAVAARLLVRPWLGLEARLGWAGSRSPTLEASSGHVEARAITAHGPFAAVVVSVTRDLAVR